MNTNLDIIYNFLYKELYYPEYDSYYTYKPFFQDDEILYKEAYEYCKNINDLNTPWEVYSKEPLFYVYKDNSFIGIVKLGWKDSLKAFTVNSFLHPSVHYRETKALAYTVAINVYEECVRLNIDNLRFYSDFASKYLINFIKDLVPKHKQNSIIYNKIYNKYIVVYWKLSLEDMRCMVKNNDSIITISSFNNWYKLYDYTKPIISLKELESFNYEPIYIDNELLGIVVIKIDKLNNILTLEFFSYYTDIVKSSYFIEKAFKNLFYSTSLFRNYKHFECVLSYREHCDVLNRLFNVSIHQVTSNYFICYKDLNNVNI